MSRSYKQLDFLEIRFGGSFCHFGFLFVYVKGLDCQRMFGAGGLMFYALLFPKNS